ncbi:MAG: formylglycine-generating enzyme family protein [Gemmataceae bacterium]|nr:formylglycine-generating enzyme family protein [Gemmataceae bacterium]
MHQMTFALFALAFCFLAVSDAGQKKKFPDPTPRKDAILNRFADEFVAITPGKGKFAESFLMGTEKAGKDNERPAHKVSFKYGFQINKYEVTQELYAAVTGINPAQFQGLRNGIDQVTWNDSVAFCEKATAQLRERKLIGDNERIRLPSEAEWEYCCRAGTTTAWSFGDDVKELGKYSWFKENSPNEDPPVGLKLPNAWGLYDMHGYVWEWCADVYHSTYEGAPSDGSARATGDTKKRVMRGGGYPDLADSQRSAFRHSADPAVKTGAIGFRCVKETISK